ncbi:MAG: hypothetical protein FJ387_03785 [Verrucomicrobia bacterium]|nr:hypothetical protein [Verrucomicrobiota bacterium]
MWRFDPGRTACSAEELPIPLHLHWVRICSPRVPVWDDPLNRDLMPYDRVFEPVALGSRLFLGFNDADRVVALDLESGQELWRFYTDGPVRLPPVAWADKVYFASDDGHLYCVRAADGVLQWKFLGAPAARKALGNRRVISAWPARGGPVLRDGTMYFAASIWPFMGTFIYALDADTGAVRWVNDGTGAQFIKQPHGAPAFGGVAPQGALVATRDLLLVPGGRSVPAAFDRHTGEFVHFRIDDGGKGNGGSLVMANDTTFFVHTRGRGVQDFNLKTGSKGTFTLNEPVLGRGHYYSGQTYSTQHTAGVEAEAKLALGQYAELKARAELRDALELADATAIKKATNAIATAVKKIAEAERQIAEAEQAQGTNWIGRVIQGIAAAKKKVLWELPVDGTGDIIQAGNRLYAAGAETLVAVQLPAANEAARVVWSHPVDGAVQRLLAARGKLIAVTLDGRIMAFGGAARSAVTVREACQPLAPSPEATARAQALLSRANARDGYVLWFGVDDGRLLEAVVAQSDLHIVAVDADARKVEALRRRFDAAGVYGTRLALHTGDPASFQAPPYLANLVVVGSDTAPRLADRGVLQAIYPSVRPYGGLLWVSSAGERQTELERHIRAAGLPQADVSATDEGIVVVRAGALPGSADWTHQYGNIANTVKSDDATVRLPLGVLWFGGNSNLEVLPRHGHGPTPQVVGGRLFLQGMTGMSARDVYTGRVLWQREISDLDTLGVYFDDTYSDAPLSTVYNQRHIPGANARGANYVATAEAVYLAVGNTCRVLSAETGATLREIAMPQAPGQPEAPAWGFIGVYEEVLLGGAGFANYSRRDDAVAATGLPSLRDLSGSAGLVAFNRHNGAVLWSADARHSFLHNGIVAGNGRVYCLDRLPQSAEDRLKRQGRPLPEDYRVAAFEARTGRLLWEQSRPVFGTWLGYASGPDLLLQAGARGADRLSDEVGQGMATHRGRDGALVWTNNLEYTGPCILHHDLIITTPVSYRTSSGALRLADGAPHRVPHPLTGELEPWTVYRTYGCNTPVASEHLLTFRSGAAGYYDLATHAGTGNFGGFRSGCSSSLIPANGVLNAPDYTRTCSCAYQNQTSLALVPMPEVEQWTFGWLSTNTTSQRRLDRLGINLGAPGDRRDPSGTLWLDFPSVGGSSPSVPIELAGSGTNFFRRHASQVSGAGLPWVAASGLRNLRSVVITPELSSTTLPAAGPTRQEEENNPDATAQTAPPAVAQATPATDNTELEPTPMTGQSLKPVSYTVRLHFVEPDGLAPGQRVFDVALQGREVLSRFDVVAVAGGNLRGVVREFRNILVPEALSVTLTPAPGSQHGPVLCGIEMIADESTGGRPTVTPAFPESAAGPPSRQAAVNQ